MLKYRKKPVEIEALKWTGNNVTEMQEFIGDHCDIKLLTFQLFNGSKIYKLLIHTPDGDMVAKVGDYIIKGVKGEFYPCNPDVFNATYEKC